MALALGSAALVVAGASVAAISAVPAQAQGRALPPPAPNTKPGELFSPHQIVSVPYVYTSPTMDYLYQSGLGTPHVPVWSFKELGKWISQGDAVPQLPPWVDAAASGDSGPIWGPSVAKIGHHYVMWFTAPWDNPNPYDGQRYPRCIGYATSSSPEGPFTNSSALQPALCQLREHGDIDPRPVDIGGHWWLYWKSNNNSFPRAPHTMIWAQRLGPGGTSLKGHPVVVYENDRPWEGQIVESPQMVVENGRFYLFFSGNAAGVPQAGIGLAVCAGPAGPCRSPYAGPWLGSNVLGAGPSELSLFTQRGATWLLYTPQATYYPGIVPQLAVSRVAFGPHGPYVASFDGATPGI